MAETKYRTSPEARSTLPPGIPYIVGNEAAERFSFYGMRTILVIFMTQYLRNQDGFLEVMTDNQAQFWYHLFVMSAYFFPLMGAILADGLLGKYRTIICLSIVYCLGHLALALDETQLGMFAGLALIAIGSGGIKPCVSAHVGDQFGKQNEHMLSRIFIWFYFAINLGSTISTLMTPKLLRWYGPGVAFGVPGVLMLLATIVFWMGRRKFVHVPAGGMGALREAFSEDGRRAMANLIPIYLFVAVFWSLFDQTGSAWVLQAQRMDLQFGIEWLPSQFQVVNPVLVMLLIPLFSYIVYPAIDRVFPLTPLRKVSIGLFITIVAFSVPAWVESEITGGSVVSKKSEPEKDAWAAENLIDGRNDGTGWVSESKETYERNRKNTPPEDLGPQFFLFPHDIVIRLRERRAWTISSVWLNPATNLEDFLLQRDEQQRARLTEEERSKLKVDERGSPELRERSRSCWAKHVEIFVGDSRKGDRTQAGDSPEGDVKKAGWAWTRKVAEIDLSQDHALQEASFQPVKAEFVLVRITSNHGGQHVSLGEVEVRADGAQPADAHVYAGPVWPNVAAIGHKPSIVWQLVAYVFLTAAEIMVSITCLEFSYTQAPRKTKSFIMGLFLASIAIGNLFTALVNWFVQSDDGGSRLDGPSYYWFFTAVMAVTALLFVFVARNYKGQTFIQDEAPASE